MNWRMPLCGPRMEGIQMAQVTPLRGSMSHPVDRTTAISPCQRKANGARNTLRCLWGTHNHNLIQISREIFLSFTLHVVRPCALERAFAVSRGGACLPLVVTNSRSLVRLETRRRFVCYSGKLLMKGHQSISSHIRAKLSAPYYYPGVIRLRELTAGNSVFHFLIKESVA